jgi:hypothetical protein
LSDEDYLENVRKARKEDKLGILKDTSKSE